MTTTQFKKGQHIVQRVQFLSKKKSELETIDKNGLNGFYLESKSGQPSCDFRLNSNASSIDCFDNQPPSISILLNVTIKMMIDYYQVEIDALEKEFDSL